MVTHIGIGNDFHRLCEGSGFWLGGVWIDCELACIADSDGDVVLHALTDALLGSCALGDIGERYPHAKAGEPSNRFVLETMLLLAARHATVRNVDCIIELERPKISQWKTAMRDTIADLLNISSRNVSVKAKTREGMDAIGQGKAVAATVALLVDINGNDND
jgi:2-C-methyl-D-erythritol 2,4-cyclodiphosphate synthase